MTTILAFIASKYYDLLKLQGDVLSDLAGSSLKDLEFEQGRYQINVDYLGTLETAARTFGLNEVGIEETELGYKLGEQEASSIEELEQAEKSVLEFADKLAAELTDKLGLPGVFYFGYNPAWRDGALRLFYAFEDSDLPLLQSMGLKMEGLDVEASFEQIIASLEQEGCYDIAAKLHSVLRGQ